MFKVETNSGVVELTPDQLIKQLIDKSVTVNKPELETLAKTLAEMVEVQGILKSSTPIHLLALGIMTGYLYKVFLQNNNVKVDNVSQSIEQSDRK